MEALWADLSGQAKKDTLSKDEGTLNKKMGKAMALLSVIIGDLFPKSIGRAFPLSPEGC